MTINKRRTKNQAHSKPLLSSRFKRHKGSSVKTVKKVNVKRDQNKSLEKEVSHEGTLKREIDLEDDSKTGTNSEEDPKKEIESVQDPKMKYEEELIGKNVSNKFAFVTEEKVSSIPTKISQPKNWSEIYNKVVAIRAKFLAPVDHVGCERIAKVVIGDHDTDHSKSYRLYLLISLMLSSQTKDEVTYQALLNLHWGLKKRGFENGITLESIIALTEEEIDKLIEKVGFHRRKASYIRSSCRILIENFAGDVPQSIEHIVSLPGVGPKMGYLLLQHAWNINSGIGVDAHVHRLSQMWGWAPKTNNPEFTRQGLEHFLPTEFWGDINPLLVGFGQVICVPNAPNCDICPLGYASLCKGAKKHLLQKPSEERIKKLRKNRADLTQLIEDIEDLV